MEKKSPQSKRSRRPIGPGALGQGQPAQGEVLALKALGEGGVAAVTAHLQVIPLTADDAGLRSVGLAGFLRAGPIGEPGAPTVVPGEPLPVAGKVVTVRPAEAILDVGSAAGVQVGDRFEIRSQERVQQFDLETGEEKSLPSDRITAVAEVVRVAEKTCLVRLGRGDRAREGDVAQRSRRPLTRTNWFPGYARNLNRIQARIAPFVGIDTLSVGAFSSLLYDRTFSFPLRVETGFRNVGFLFGDSFAAPFQFDLIPSYDTDYFEVGLGAGYSFSSSPDRRGVSFLQKVRLGTVDGLNFTMWNSFIYRDKDDPWADGGFFSGNLADVGSNCTAEFHDEPDGGQGEFAWNGFDAALSIPLTDRVTLVGTGAYSQAGWAYGDIGIRTLVLGNGGKGTLIIPVSIGGGVVFDYPRSGEEAWCNPQTQKYEAADRYREEAVGGPIVSLGVDYRF